MSIAEKLAVVSANNVTIAENEQKVFEAGQKSSAKTEIEITSTISNTLQLANIIFANIPNNHICTACLTKPKNNPYLENQIYLLYMSDKTKNAGRYRNGSYSNVGINISFDANVAIGDVFEIYDFGEAQYDN